MTEQPTPNAAVSRETALALIGDANRWERAYRRLADALNGEAIPNV